MNIYIYISSGNCGDVTSIPEEEASAIFNVK
ncbi:hypothetical protein NC653_009587 [Populus alba x Populus x berolinensis]|uniref:Uncharacterized protein n=1 Tax=Populus alba x Populus x berolinensis TaxID=444605 RepID=A0AAD6W9X7_9ROSI|nr:hypothetical protein NC653_009587 [Populus alba x Populus x berolinensis]